MDLTIACLDRCCQTHRLTFIEQSRWIGGRPRRQRLPVTRRRPPGYASLMAPRTQTIIAEALRLPVRARARLAAELLASIDGEPDTGAEEAWSVEIARRARVALSRKSPGTPWATVRQRIRTSRSGRK